VKELGPYIVVAPGVAMPHARPEDGAIATGMSLVTLKEPVVFGNPDNDPVRLVIGLAALDAQAHLHALATLVELLGDPEMVRQISRQLSAEAILGLMRTFEATASPQASAAVSQTQEERGERYAEADDCDCLRLRPGVKLDGQNCH